MQSWELREEMRSQDKLGNEIDNSSCHPERSRRIRTNSVDRFDLFKNCESSNESVLSIDEGLRLTIQMNTFYGSVLKIVRN